MDCRRIKLHLQQRVNFWLRLVHHSTTRIIITMPHHTHPYIPTPTTTTSISTTPSLLQPPLPYPSPTTPIMPPHPQPPTSPHPTPITPFPPPPPRFPNSPLPPQPLLHRWSRVISLILDQAHLGTHPLALLLHLLLHQVETHSQQGQAER